MSEEVLTPGERRLVESAQPRRDDLVHLVYRLVAEVERLRRPRTQHCPVCEAFLAERDRYARALRRFYDAWIRAESNRGCYSCCEQHDSRCMLARNGKPCTCGRDELEKAVTDVEVVLGEREATP